MSPHRGIDHRRARPGWARSATTDHRLAAGAAHVGQRRVELGRAHVGQDHAGAGAGEEPRGGAPDTGRRAGDDGHAAVEAQQHRRIRRRSGSLPGRSLSRIGRPLLAIPAVLQHHARAEQRGAAELERLLDVGTEELSRPAGTSDVMSTTSAAAMTIAPATMTQEETWRASAQGIRATGPRRARRRRPRRARPGEDGQQTGYQVPRLSRSWSEPTYTRPIRPPTIAPGSRSSRPPPARARRSPRRPAGTGPSASPARARRRAVSSATQAAARWTPTVAASIGPDSLQSACTYAGQNPPSAPTPSTGSAAASPIARARQIGARARGGVQKAPARRQARRAAGAPRRETRPCRTAEPGLIEVLQRVAGRDARSGRGRAARRRPRSTAGSPRRRAAPARRPCPHRATRPWATCAAV